MQIPSLCLHSRITETDPMRPTSELSFTGTFSMSDMHAWVSRLLPDVPPTVHDTNEVYLAFTNAVLGMQLSCRWVSGAEAFDRGRRFSKVVWVKHMEQQCQ
ncbi:hypothetical protein DUNSADRAFT_4303 [Dunaliella salina]|uniref:BBS7 platform domain-containing protein n=1 Tax=Dunaliella salina TaxID=3046 RepID=A0ABQ7FV23_DUNSA|nr:hypothetical protein DUNSADRAFT_4303 [Dunaliella salina]|eukprot:KAF5826178.1 hypothetical protein DUNSADRAFT_4303 [Dunaliella salina]